MKIKKVLDLLELVSSIIFICFLIAVLFFALQYWTTNISNVQEFNAQMFSVAMLIALVTVIAEWIDGRIKAIIKVWKILKRGYYYG